MQQKIYNTLEEAQEAFTSKNIFLVTGKKSFESSGARERLSLGNYTYFNDFSPNPKLEDAIKGIELYRKSNPDLILAVGGGSVIDMAKLIKGLASEADIKNSITTNRITGSNVPLISIPTTSGSGSESTPFAVVYINGFKYSLQHDTLLPNEVVLDPSLTYSLPREQTAATGMDALSQSIEAFWSVNSTTESKQHSRVAIPLILDNLEQAVNNPTNSNREAMMKASNLAGRAIVIAKTTACHSISYPITSHFGVPHGHAAALTLGEVLVYNSLVSESDCIDSRGITYVQNTMQELFSLLKVQNAPDGNKRITDLMQSIGLETQLSKLANHPEIIIKEGFNPQRMKNNPRKIEENDLRKILDKLK